jgi:hypothetical protein
MGLETVESKMKHRTKKFLVLESMQNCCTSNHKTCSTRDRYQLGADGELLFLEFGLEWELTLQAD